MANNPNVNKVIYGNRTVMDISDTTATEDDVVSGKTFYKANGAKGTGSAVIPDISNCYQTTDTAETDIQDADYFPFYDSSASGKRKSLWSNIKSKLKTYFDTVYMSKGSVSRYYSENYDAGSTIAVISGIPQSKITANTRIEILADDGTTTGATLSYTSYSLTAVSGNSTYNLTINFSSLARQTKFAVDLITI